MLLKCWTAVTTWETISLSWFLYDLLLLSNEARDNAAPPRTIGQSAGCTKHLPSAKFGQFCFLGQVSDILAPVRGARSYRT
jgi:hypothetical protein